MSTKQIPYIQTLTSSIRSIQDTLWILKHENDIPKDIINKMQAQIGYLSMHVGELKQAWHKASTL